VGEFASLMCEKKDFFLLLSDGLGERLASEFKTRTEGETSGNK
jgi:hypothetical protein